MPSLKHLHTPLLSALLLILALPACDKKEDKKDEAANEEDELDKKVKERLAKKEAEREAAKKAAEEAEAAKQKKLDEICVLPEEMPKKLEKACDQVAEANDAFMTRLYEGEAVERWNQAKGTQLPMTKAQCMKSGSIEVAACQINGMNNAPPELKKALPDILRACHEKFGAAAEGDEGGGEQPT